MITIEDLESEESESITVPLSFTFTESEAERIRRGKALVKDRLKKSARKKLNKKYRQAILAVTREVEKLFEEAS